MFTRIMAVVLTVILLLTGMLSGIGWLALREQQTAATMEQLRSEAREIAYLAGQRSDSVLPFFDRGGSDPGMHLQWKANAVYEE